MASVSCEEKIKITIDMTHEEFEKAIVQYKGKELRRFIPYYFIPFSAFEIYEDDFRHLGLYKIAIEMLYENYGIPVECILWYNSSKIMILEDGIMQKDQEVVIELNYADRENSVPIIRKIAEKIPLEGKCTLFANNVPYNLELILVVATPEHYDEIISFAKEKKLKLDFSRNFRECMRDLYRRGYNAIEILPNFDEQEIHKAMNNICVFPSALEYETKGYSTPKEKKKKVFVSYCHKDKERVRAIIEVLRSHGLNVWLDECEIDFGDNLLERVDEGIGECHLGLLFLSNNTKTAAFAKHELTIFYGKIIYQSGTRKKWLLVRLDDVHLDNIYHGLGQYKYFDMKEFSIEQLYDAIEKN